MNEFPIEEDHATFWSNCIVLLLGGKKMRGLGLVTWEDGCITTVQVTGSIPSTFERACMSKWREIGEKGWELATGGNVRFEWDSSPVAGGRADIRTLPTCGVMFDLIVDHQQEQTAIASFSRKSSSKGVQEKALVIDEKAPYHVAKQLLLLDWTWCAGMDEEARTLHRIGGELFMWNSSNYVAMTDDAMRAELYERFAGAVRLSDATPLNPDRNLIAKVVDALYAAAHLDGDSVNDFWIDDDGASGLIAVQNGLLDPSTRVVSPHTPRYFNRCALPIWYEPGRHGEPREWLGFLHSVWGDDAESIRLLQQWFGYLVAGGRDQQKILLLVGPSRSGKGTIAGVLTQLLGAINVAGPSLGDFSTQFGLAQLLGKRAAIVGDARFAGRADQMAQVATRLLSISSGDTLTVDRKYGQPWIGVLPVRLVICTNEVPRLPDQSGALASRFSVLRMQRSHLGSEDRGLADRLHKELPEILAWALDGLNDLLAAGRFVEPASSASTTADLAELGSPVQSFVADECEIDVGAKTTCEVLFRAWCKWCETQGRDHPGSLAMFGRDLRAAFPAINTEQHRAGALRGKRGYTGIRLRPESAF
ncbi:MAG: phage/plasmid primase, P4 family [Pseudomonadota bacterium]